MTTRPSTHPYQADPDAPADWKGEQPCTCGLPSANQAHDLPDVPEQAEHRRRIGEDDDE